MDPLRQMKEDAERHRQLLANKKLVWKRNLPKEQDYWRLRSLLRTCHVLDRDTDNYSSEHLSCMVRLYAWARKGKFIKHKEVKKVVI